MWDIKVLFKVPRNLRQQWVVEASSRGTTYQQFILQTLLL